MATDYTKGASRVRWGADEHERVFLLRNELDTELQNQTQNNVAEMLPIKAGMFVRNVWIEVLTAEGGTLTLDVGDGSDVDAWHDGIDGNATGETSWAPMTGSVAWNPNAIATAAEEVKAITVAGSKLGDFVEVSFSLDLEDLALSGMVQAADAVEAILVNVSGGSVTLGSGTAYALVKSVTEVYSRNGGKLYTADDTIDIKWLNAADKAKVRIVAAVEWVFDS